MQIALLAFRFMAISGALAQAVMLPGDHSSNAFRRAATNSSACSGNSANDRSVWCDYDIDTNYYDEVPNTGVTVEYWFELQNVTTAPDGVSRNALTVNGSFPGPTIFADWGDTVKVHLTNSLANNGTSLHFHGVRQNWTNSGTLIHAHHLCLPLADFPCTEDGVASITQCPVAPDDSITYTWRATQYGSSWYHSHFSLQAWEGVLGGIVINGPATANYDEDLGIVLLNDWDHQTVDELYSYAQTQGPPTLDTGLINGTNVWEDGGSYFETSVEEGKSYRMRLVNGAADTHFDFMIDNHTMQVIASDFVPIEPYYTDVLSIGMGQRYDVVVNANMSAVADDFWIRAIPDSFCSENDNSNHIRGILHYGSSTGTPQTSAPDFDENNCAGESSENIVPYLAIDAGSSADSSDDLAVTISTNSDNLFKWYIGGTTFLVDWSNPTAQQVLDNTTTFSDSSVAIELPTADEIYYLIIETTLAVPHPIHIHVGTLIQLSDHTIAY